MNIDNQTKSVFKGTLAAMAVYGVVKMAFVAGSSWYAKRKIQKALKAATE